MLKWAEAIATGDERPAAVFAQEVSDEWLEVWCAAGYGITVGTDRGWKIRSALITSSEVNIAPIPEGVWSNAYYHGSYVAAGLWTDAPGGAVALCSVHASPAIANPLLYGWAESAEVPRRHGGGDPRWTGGTLWDADYLAASLREMSTATPLLVAGDFNEARDDVYFDSSGASGSWGQEYFNSLESADLVEVSLRDGREAFPTRGRLQLDHILATASLVDRLELGNVRLDKEWDNPGHSLSDHSALWFDLRVM
jgi:hypothetical protein